MNAFPSPAHQTGADDPTPDPSMEEILASIRRIIADDQGAAPSTRPSGPPANSSARPSAQTSATPHYAPAPQQQRRQDAPRQDAPAPQPFTIEAEAVKPAPRVEAQQVYAQPAPRQYAAPQPPVQPQQYAPQQYASQPAPQPAPQLAPQYAPQQAPQYALAPEPQPVYAPPAPQPVQQAHQPEPAAFSAPVVAANLPTEPSLLSAQADASVTNAFEALTRSMMLQNSPFMEETVRDLLRPMLKQWLDDNLPPLVERLVRSEIERVARGGR